MSHKLAGIKVPKENLENIPNLISSYYVNKPDVSEVTQKVSFGTSGHRGNSNKISFNENHILAITQALCEYRVKNNITGTLFIGKDSHALSTPAQITTLQVCISNNVKCKIAQNDEYTPTPLISFTILEANKNAKELNDGVVITPSHNPPSDGGFKYNPPNGGPADTDVTNIIQNRANEILENDLKDVKSVSLKEVLKSELLEEFDFVTPYVKSLNEIINIDVIKESKLRIGVDPMGGSGIEVYKKIKEIYNLDIEIVNEFVDPTFSFMTCDHDGKVRMDCSSKFAMASLIDLKDKYDIAFSNDPDFDRHGIVTPSVGLMNPNHYLSVAIWYLYSNRKQWSDTLGIGKTLVSSSMIDRIAKSLDKNLYEVPVGFKWFVDGLYEGTLGFGGEESAGASFLRKDASAWSTDKDGIILNLLAAEITAVCKKDPGVIYQEFEKEFGESFYERMDAPASLEQKAKLKNLSVEDITTDTLAGEEIENIFTNASGNNASIGGLKVSTKNGWFAARPSGTEDIYKIYAESFISAKHLKEIQKQAQEIVLKSIS
ncbi:phosphoglucomutase (alpha-D-glucose-1,6-bisphosphate-dependent) [Poseidonibacter lekithochrous]|uniref:phosphoglucomutase (alpha-D-glucose-1,6-bisphosphate-dependent) n=1 Tax=Poseidonibacter lekithochrous TaxID=1904463 RepID=UPI0008FC9216|nr:phosphoglucomutase (alpha-D-glucose-1,6-bisphosphate-dependent) [Poseidonibacter lekithochrous]QKJ24017.1 phosphoglucomutase [Poseidonibacter lekithochrous]